MGHLIRKYKLKTFIVDTHLSDVENIIIKIIENQIKDLKPFFVMPEYPHSVFFINYDTKELGFEVDNKFIKIKYNFYISLIEKYSLDKDDLKDFLKYMIVNKILSNYYNKLDYREYYIIELYNIEKEKAEIKKPINKILSKLRNILNRIWYD